MNSTIKTPILAVAALVILALLLSLYSVQQTQYALKVEFGKVKGVEDNPGLHFKIPFIQRILYFEKRIQTLDSQAGRFLTKEKKNVIVDSYVKWKINDVVKFYTSVHGKEERAGQRLSEIIADGLRREFGTRTIRDVVSGDRNQIMAQITSEASERASQFGIEVVDVRIKRIDLPKEVSESVYQRMRAERERVARDLRAQGGAEAVRIHADADKQKVVLLAEALREAEQLRGHGDAEAARIYSQAFSKDAEFFALYRSLAAYRETFKNRGDVLVLEPDSAFFQYFKDSAPAH